MSWLIWIGILFFILKKGSNGLKKMIEDNQNQANREFEETAMRDAEREAQLAEWREEARSNIGTSTLPSTPKATPKGYQRLDVPVEIEGGRLMVELLDDKGVGNGNAYADDILHLENAAHSTQSTLRTAVVMKEVLDRKYQ